MLNELFELRTSLESAQIKLQDWHKHYKDLPKKQPLLVLLDEEGSVVDLEICSDEKKKIVRKWETSNGYSFPAFNTPPLVEIATAEEPKMIQDQKKKLQAGNLESWSFWQSQIENGSLCWKDDNTSKKITKSIQDVRKDLRSKLPPIPDEFQSFEQLLQRCEKIDLDNFRMQIQERLIEKLKKELKNKIWFEALFHIGGKLSNNIQWILDIDDSSDFEYPTTHSKTIFWINEQLLKNPQPSPQTEFSIPTKITIDPYGNPQNGWEEKLPKIKLPSIENVILRAMTKEAPCQTRYGKIESQGFPVGEATSMKMKTALEWLSKDEYEGKTWRNISRVRGETSLLFAYPSHLPQKDPNGPFADFFAGSDQTDPDGTFFVTCAESVIQALKGIPEEADAEFRVFVLTKPDGHRTKVQFDQGYKVERVIQSAIDWRAGGNNIPEITLRIFPKDTPKKPVSSSPFIPSPGELIWCCNTIWSESSARGESSPHLAKNAAMKDGLLLLLDNGHRSEKTAIFLLQKLLSHALPLLLRIGQCIPEGIVCTLHQKYSKQVLLLPSILGVLLYKLDKMKGDYMQSSFYLIGRLLSLSDQIHRIYAKEVRDDESPSKLMGNSIMQTALEQPEKALAVFSQRFLPYQLWAQTANIGGDTKLLRFFLKEIGIVCDQLKEQEIPTRCNDAEKAQMILGYLAKNSARPQEPSNQETT